MDLAPEDELYRLLGLVSQRVDRRQQTIARLRFWLTAAGDGEQRERLEAIIAHADASLERGLQRQRWLLTQLLRHHALADPGDKEADYDGGRGGSLRPARGVEGVPDGDAGPRQRVDG